VKRNRFWCGLGCTALTVAMLSGCSGGGGGSSGRMIIVQGISPTNGQELSTVPDAVRNQEIVITFSGPPRRETVIDPTQVGGLTSNVRIRNHRSERVAGVPFLGGRDPEGRTVRQRQPNVNAALAAVLDRDGEEILRFVADTDGDLNSIETFPIDPRLNPPGEQISVRVTTGVTNRAGEPLLEPFCSSFSVGRDVIKPTVVTTTPVTNAQNVDLRAPIELIFSESMNVSSVLTSMRVTAQVVSPAAAPASGVIPGTVSQPNPNDACRFVFTPSVPYPGSPPGGNSIITLTVNSSASGAVDLQNNVLGDANNAGIPFPPGFQVVFTAAPQPPVANGPAVPGVTFFGRSSPPGVGAISSEWIPGFVLLGDINGDGVRDAADDGIVVPNSINTSVGTPLDMVVGPFITPGQTVVNPPFPNPPPPQPVFSTATTVPSICGIPPVAIPNNTNADFGNFLYVSDSENNVVQVLNSQSMQVLTAIPTPDPTGLTISFDGRFLFVTNFGTNTVSVIDTRRNSPTFHQVIGTIPVGQGPRGIACQPDNEDVIVVNSLSRSLSIISLSENMRVRKTIVNDLLGPEPWEVAITYRLPGPPFFIRPGVVGSFTYFAYITNRAGNSVSIFESGPSFPTMFGPDDMRSRIDDLPESPIRQPLGISWDFREGAWFVNNGDGTVARVDLTFSDLPPNPYFPNPRPNRLFGIVQRTASLGSGATDIAMTSSIFPCTGALPLALSGYVAVPGSGQVVQFDATNATILKRIPVGNVTTVTTFLEQ
jgi:YVTN family beta-propeller protein